MMCMTVLNTECPSSGGTPKSCQNVVSAPALPNQTTLCKRTYSG